MHRLRSLSLTPLLAGLFIVGACASTPKPETQIASSEGAIRGASEAGAGSVPKATLHLRLAQEQRDLAMALIEDDENERASLVLARSEADAELAIALARQAAAEREASMANEKVQEVEKKVQQ